MKTFMIALASIATVRASSEVSVSDSQTSSLFSSSSSLSVPSMFDFSSLSLSSLSDSSASHDFCQVTAVAASPARYLYFAEPSPNLCSIDDDDSSFSLNSFSGDDDDDDNNWIPVATETNALRQDACFLTAAPFLPTSSSDEIGATSSDDDDDSSDSSDKKRKRSSVHQCESILFFLKKIE